MCGDKREEPGCCVTPELFYLLIDIKILFLEDFEGQTSANFSKKDYASFFQYHFVILVGGKSYRISVFNSMISIVYICVGIKSH